MNTSVDKAAVAASALDIDQKIIEIIDRIQSGVVQHAPAAMDLALNVVRVDSAAQIATGFLLFLAFLGGLLCCRNAARYAIGLNRWQSLSPPDDEPYRKYRKSEPIILASVGAAVPLLIVGLHGINRLFSVWNWVGVFYPELRLAKDVFDAVMK